MVTYSKSDLDFILEQILIAEAQAAGADPASVVAHYSLPFGLRTVDGTYNNLLPGNEEFGAADTLFPRIVPSNPINLEPGGAVTNGETFDANGPAPGGVVSNNNYGIGGSVVDSAPRTISNLIVDQTLANPAAIAAALKVAGSENIFADTQAIVAAVQAVADARAAAEASSAEEVADLLAILEGLQQTLNGPGGLQEAANSAVAAEVVAQSEFDAAQAARDADAADLQAAQLNLNTVVGAALADFTVTDDEQALINAALDAVTAANLDLNGPDNVDLTDGTAGVLATETAELSTAEALVTSTAQAVSNQQALIAIAQQNYDVALAADVSGDAAVVAAESDLAALVDEAGIIGPNGNLIITNVATDEGLSASFNSWFTFFGQFFDHGLDLVTKVGNGTVFIPLQPDDPLITLGPDGIAGTGDEVTNPALQFMTLTRATPTMVDPDGPSGPLPAVAQHTNTTTSWVDQNQTYTSHASHQVFLREYVFNGDGNPVATGKLLENRAPNATGDYYGVGSVDLGGIASWGFVKAQARELLGISLTDADVTNVPLLRTDPFGKFIPDPATGFAQVIRGAGPDGEFNTEDDVVAVGSPSAPVDLFAVGAVRTGHAFLDDIAHTAGPVFLPDDGDPLTPRDLAPDADDDVGNTVATNPITGQRLEYDNELLDAHKVTGDGRGNENIALTTVHHVFHSEHNNLAEHTKLVAVESAIAMGGEAGLAFLNAWLDTGSQETELPLDASQASIDALTWNGERIFQAAKFGTEMQYQHLVFEEFARKVQPLVNIFGPYNAEIDPSIVAEFAHVVYRFGHSMLAEDVARMNPDGTVNDVGLIEAFLNPVLFDAGGSAEVSAGAIIRGSTRQVGNEIDEFVVGALRNNLLGLPLDLPVLNIARARDTGAPTLNEARAQFYAGTGDEQLKPYDSWVDFALHAKNELSVVNFIAAYGTHAAVLAAVTLEDKRKAATALVLGDGYDNTVLIDGQEISIADRFDFLNSTGAWTAANSGLNDIDLWIGGLAEAQQPFGGLLGSTFNFVFETQMENLQDSDRFYYLGRLAGTHFLTELEGNSFAQMVMNNTDLGEGGMHLPGDIFSVPNWILEMDQSKQVTGLDANGDPVASGVGRGDPTGDSIFTPLVVRGPNYLKYTGGDHVVLGGTEGNETLIAGIGDDTIWGDGGNDRIEGGAGVDQLIGGDGDDIITDINGDDNIKGGSGNDVVNSGDGFDLILLGDGNDFSVGGEDANETFGGEGNDYIIAGDDGDIVFGDAGDDWIEGGTGNDLLQGDFGAPFQDSAHAGNDIIIGGPGGDDYDSESGDDIMLADDGIERNEGMLGFDWVTYKNDTQPAQADLFFRGLLPPDLDAIRDRFDQVEGLSGWDFDDVLRGDDADSVFLSDVDPVSGHNNALNTVEQINLIDGLQELLGSGVTSFSGGNIILGGGGSDIIEGRGGDDIIDGDAKLNVRLSIRANNDGTGDELGWADGMSTPITGGIHAGKSLVELMFNGTLNPGQLQIVREIITDDTSGVDIAQFSDSIANYTFSLPDDNDFITVSHNDAVLGAGQGADGVDRIRNIEALQFSDALVVLDGDIDNTPATGELEISDGGDGNTVGQQLIVLIGTVEDADNELGLVNLADISLAWQVELTPGLGDWVPIEDPITEIPVLGPTFTPTAAFEIEGLRLRVVGTFVGANGIPEFVTSGATDPVAPAAVTTATELDDLITGTVGADLINALAGDDEVFALAGNDTIIGGPGNDILDGGTDTGGELGDIAVFFGPLANFSFLLNAEGQLEVVSADPAEEDAVIGIETVIVIDAPAPLDDADVAALINNLRLAPPADGVTVNIDGALVTLRSVAGILGGETIVDTAGADVLEGGDFDDTLIGLGGDDAIDGGVGNDTIFGDGVNPANSLPQGADGDDTIGWRVGDGRDLIDGGGNTAVGDTFEARGSDAGDLFTIYSRAAAVAAGLGSFSLTTEIVVTRQAIGEEQEIIAELDNIEAIVINNTPVVAGTTVVGGDTVAVVGDLSGTSLITNLPPTGMTLNGGDTGEVTENSAGAIIGPIVVSDPNPGDTHTFEISDDRFEVVGGNLKLKDGISLDFETESQIDLVINVFDQDGQGSTNNPYDITITVSDGNDAPVIAGLLVSEVYEGEPGALIGVIDVTDPDTSNAGFSFEVTNVDTGAIDNRFTVVNIEGAWTLKLTDTAVLEQEDGEFVNLSIVAIDSDGVASAPHVETITVINVNETPVGLPTISNAKPVKGQSLTASIAAITDGDGLTQASFAYQWESSVDGVTWTSITGATSANFTPTQAEVGRLLHVVTTFTDDGGEIEVVESDPTGIVGNSITGTNGGNTLNGTAGNDNIFGLGGGDTLRGFGGDDVLDGGLGSDNLQGGEGNDTLIGGTNGGSDTLDGGLGDDTMIGGGGNDTYFVDSALDVVTEGSGGGNDTVRTSLQSYTLGNEVENLAVIAGSTGDRAFTGNTLNNTITSNGGSDVLTGLQGNDTLIGNGGNDRFVATINDGNDVYSGGSGSDTYDLSGTNAGANVNLASGRASSAETGNDILLSIENVKGSNGANTITGNGGANVLDGLGGNDTINGGGGADRITGGAGNDTMNGGAGNDTFVFAPNFGADTIVGFDANPGPNPPALNQDLLDISAFGINAEEFAASVSITTGLFDAVAGVDTRVTIGADTITFGGVTGLGANVITQADFIL